MLKVMVANSIKPSGFIDAFGCLLNPYSSLGPDEPGIIQGLVRDARTEQGAEVLSRLGVGVIERGQLVVDEASEHRRGERSTHQAVASDATELDPPGGRSLGLTHRLEWKRQSCEHKEMFVDALAALIACYPAHAEHEAVWGSSTLQVSEHLSTSLPPDELITSVRAVVLVGDQVLVVHDPHALHILPGGRREPGETLEATLRREVLEETGWELGAPLLVGFRHLRHLTPRPPAYRYPYPSFLHLVYAAPGVAHHPEARKADDYVQGSSLKPLAEASSLALPAGQLHFLEAARAALQG